ncbi:MAG TPA: hypothetical protein VH325_15300 [Bryobacteraceae bacterium]|jgi:hypothetical protein|nr:hypothetical protein [Bryobacteraceae bacterium]
MADIWRMSAQDKIAEAIKRSVKYMPAQLGQAVMALLSPTSLAIITATLVAWAGSQFFGVGEIVDIILLAGGFILLGWSVKDVAVDLYRFATGALNAKTDQDLEAAAQYFAKAVVTGGIDLVTAVLLHKSAKDVIGRGKPTIDPGLPDPGPPPAGKGPFYKPTVSYPMTLPSGALGETDWYGNISVTRSQTLSEQQITYYHESVHSFLAPKLRVLQRLQAGLRASAYWRSSLLRYLEETAAEFYGQLRVNGIGQAVRAVTFPIDGGYVTWGDIGSEGVAIGNIVVGGYQLRVQVVPGPMPRPSPQAQQQPTPSPGPAPTPTPAPSL